MRQKQEGGSLLPPPQLPVRSTGTQAVVGVVIAVVGALAAANPRNTVLRALNDAAPQIAMTVPTVITACGAIIAAFSRPPRWGRRS